MNTSNGAGYAGLVTQCQCSHCGEMYASNYIHTCDSVDGQYAEFLRQPRSFVPQERRCTCQGGRSRHRHGCPLYRPPTTQGRQP